MNISDVTQYKLNTMLDLLSQSFIFSSTILSYYPFCEHHPAVVPNIIPIYHKILFILCSLHLSEFCYLSMRL